MKSSHKVGGAGAILCACAFIAPWEGLWTTAKIDTVGTNHPVTIGYGATKAEIPNLKVGDKITQKEAAALLEKGLPKYWNGISPCIHVALPDKVKASLISAAYNAGSSAVCHSPMIAKMNTGDIFGGCDAFRGWYIRASGRVVRGLINRRNGEAKLCLEGANEPINLPTVQKPSLWRKIIDFITSLFKRS